MPVIPKEKIAAFARWQLDSFDAPPTPVAQPIERATPKETAEKDTSQIGSIPLPTAESIEKMHDEARKEGYREGFDSGEKAGYQAGLERARQEAEHLAQLADHFEKALASLDQDIADAVLELSISIARQVVQQQLNLQPESIISVIRAALTSLPLHHGNINIHTHPEDARLIREQLGNQIAQSGWHLIDDASIERGGCLVRAGSSEVDATFATRWRRVLEALGKTPETET